MYDHLGQDCSMEQMEGIRDQQESLARLHFELTTKQDLTQPMSEDGKNVSFVLYYPLIPALGYNLTTSNIELYFDINY